MLPTGLDEAENQALFQQIQTLGPLEASTWAKVVASGKVEKIAKGQFLSQPGDPTAAFGFVLEGFFRSYYADDKGRESVKAFRGKHELVGPYAELIQKKPSRTFIQAVTDSRVLMVPAADFDAAADADPALQRLARRFVETHFVAKEQREYEFLQLSAAERYDAFCASYPALLPLLPQHQIASYIGITPVALSRLRARQLTQRKAMRAQAE